MKSVSGKAFARILERHGWTLARITGSHHIFMKPGYVLRISVPVHSHQPLKVGLLKHFMKVAGLQESDLE